MHAGDRYQILRRPLVSEKSYQLMDTGVYTFEVDTDATKIDVRKAVEQLFEVKVAKVNTLNRKGKSNRNRRTGKISFRPDTKIAYVTLREGFAIELLQR